MGRDEAKSQRYGTISISPFPHFPISFGCSLRFACSFHDDVHCWPNIPALQRAVVLKLWGAAAEFMLQLQT